MSRALDWEKAKRKDTVKRNRPAQRSRKGEVQYALAKFVKQHQIGCFVCGTEQADWAKTGISKRGPWAICRGCVHRPSG